MKVSPQKSSKSSSQGSPQTQKPKEQAPHNNLAQLAPPQGELSPSACEKLEKLKIGVLQLPELFKSYFYESNEQTTPDRIMQFQLFKISGLEELFNEVKNELTKELIDQNKASSPFQRSEFYEIITSDLMSLITYSKFEVNSLCLVGFDIYIGPYEAILDIISRLNRLTEEVRARLALPDIVEVVQEGKVDKELAIKKGYEYFRLHSISCLIDLNLYFLSEYAKKAVKALDKRCREMIFTGCSSLISQLTPLLSQLHLDNNLTSLLTANFSLLMMHPSYDYFFAFGKIPVEDSFQPLYMQIKSVLDKYLLTYTLTPFMFGILRNYEVFANFFKKIDSKIWVKYALVFIEGVVITIKSNSLRFREVTDLLNLAGERSYLSNSVFETLMEKLTGPLPEEWAEVDSFFRSAIKSGYNVGVYPAFNRLNQQEIEIILRNCLFNSISCLEDCSDGRTVDRWLSIIESDPDQRVHRLMELLETTIKKIQPNFASANMNVLKYEGIPKTTMQLIEINRNLHRILTVIKLLEISGKNVIDNQTFRGYLLSVVGELYQQTKTKTELIEYLLLKGTISRQALQHNLSFVAKLPLSEEFHVQFLNKFFPAKCDRPFTKDIIHYIKKCIQNGQFTPLLQLAVEQAFFSELFLPNKNYLKYTFADLKTDQIPSLSTLSFFSETELYKLLQSSFTIDPKTNVLTLKDHLVDITYPTTVKTLHDEVVTDIIYFELSDKSKQLLAELIQSYVAGFKDKIQTRTILENIVLRYPIVGFYVLDYPVPTKNLIPILKEANFPEYLHFGCVLLKLSKLEPSCFTLLHRLLLNRSIITQTGESLLKILTVPNILSLLCKSLKAASQQPNKQHCIELLSQLYTFISNPLIVDKDKAQGMVPAALDIIRLIIKDTAKQQVLTLMELFDKFVKLDVEDNYSNVQAQLSRENVKYTSGQNLLSAPAGEFALGEVVILGQDSDQALLTKMTTKYANQPHKFSKYSVNLSKINFVTRPQKDKSPLKPSFEKQSPKQAPGSILDEILGSDKASILQYVSSTNPNSYATVYRYPELNFRQVCTCLSAFLKDNNLSVIDYCILNYATTFLMELVVIDLYMFGVGRYKNYIEIGHEEKMNQKLLIIMEKIGLTKVMGLKGKELYKIPHEITLLQNMKNSEQSILCGFLKKVLKSEQVNFCTFFSSFLSDYIISHTYQILYDTVLDGECINLIQLKLNHPGIDRLSFLLHACPVNFRTYIGSLIDGMVKMMMPSKILNYNQYLKLTNQFAPEDEFVELFRIYKVNWEFYGKVLMEKQKTSTKESKISLYYKSINSRPIQQILDEYFKEIESNNLNLLSSTAQLTHKSHLNDTLRRHCELFTALRSLLPKDSPYLQSLSLIPPLKQICHLFDSDLVLADFLVGNKYNSQLLQKSDIQLPKNIQLWEENTGQTQNTPIDEIKPYVKDIELEELANLRGRRGVKFNILVGGQAKHDLVLWREQLQKMSAKKLITQGKVIDFGECPEQGLTQFRLLGLLLGNMLIKGTKIQDRFTKEITHYLVQRKLPWTLIESNKDTYNFITDLLKRETVKDMNLKFDTKQGDNTIELIPKGSEKKVNDFNKMDYCNLLALRLLKSNRAACCEFVNGVYSVSPRFNLNLKDFLQ